MSYAALRVKKQNQIDHSVYVSSAQKNLILQIHQQRENSNKNGHEAPKKSKSSYQV